LLVVRELLTGNRRQEVQEFRRQEAGVRSSGGKK
jgi:hypothetical protein